MKLGYSALTYDHGLNDEIDLTEEVTEEVLVEQKRPFPWWLVIAAGIYYYSQQG